MTDAMTIVQFSPADLEANLAGLTEILHASVMAGASINFILPYEAADAARFWTDKVLPGLRGEKLVMLVAWIDGRIAGIHARRIGHGWQHHRLPRPARDGRGPRAPQWCSRSPAGARAPSVGAPEFWCAGAGAAAPEGA